MRVRVTHSIDDLAADLAKGATTVPRKGPRMVADSTRLGLKTAQRLARQKAGPHGASYWKRLSSESTGLTGEWGPDGTPKTNFVGAGWRNARNMDLPLSGDAARNDLGKRARSLYDDIFWPGGES